MLDLDAARRARVDARRREARGRAFDRFEATPAPWAELLVLGLAAAVGLWVLVRGRA